MDLEILEVFAGFVSTALSNHAFIARLQSARAQIQRASDLAASTAGLRTLGEITGNLVHHIVTDISSARQELIHILQSLNPPGPIKASLLIAKRNTSRVLALVNGLLDRIGDISDFEGTQVDVGQAIEDAISAKEVSIPRNIKLTKSLPDGATPGTFYRFASPSHSRANTQRNESYRPRYWRNCHRGSGGKQLR